MNRSHRPIQATGWWEQPQFSAGLSAPAAPALPHGQRRNGIDEALRELARSNRLAYNPFARRER